MRIIHAHKSWVFASGILVFAAALFIATCGSDPVVHTDTPVAPTGYLNMNDSVAFVGRDACRSCHEDKFASFAESEMGRSFKEGKLSLSAANWHGAHAVYDQFSDLWYQPVARGEELFIYEYRLAGKDTAHRRMERVDYIVGSGQHTNSHIRNQNGYLYQMPLTWYAQDGKWDLPPGFEKGMNSRFSRTIEIECMSCHNGRPDYVTGSDNKYNAVPHGIDCERCHGPGALHVSEQQKGDMRYVVDGVDYTIVHPGKISAELQFDICQRCHLQGTAVPLDGKSFQDFRPGMRLHDVMNVFLPRYADSLDQFIMASHPDRLRMSKCYTSAAAGGGKAMTCVTCHDPHLSIKAQGPEVYRAKCENCHAPRSPQWCRLDSAKVRAADFNCVKCHLPVSGSADIPHVRITDHYIRVPDRQLSGAQVQQQKEFVRLACLTTPNASPEVMAEGYMAYFEQFNPEEIFLDSAAVWMNKALKTKSQKDLFRPLVRLYYLQNDFAALKEISKDIQPTSIQDAWTAYRISECWKLFGDSDRELQWALRAVNLAPDHLKFRAKYAEVLLRQKKYQESLAQFDEVIKRNPAFETVHGNRGFAHLQLGHIPEAESDFEAEIALNPDAEKALANLASLYYNTGRSPKAIPLVKRLLKLSPDNPEYRKFAEALQ